MLTLKKTILALSAATTLACLPFTPALAHGHDGGREIGHGLVGALVTLATLPLVITADVLSGGRRDDYYAAPPDSYGRAPAYAPSPGYYAPPRVAYAPRPQYYAPERSYYGGGSRSYEPSRGYYGAPRYSGSYGGYGGRSDHSRYGDHYRH
jgi:hypothetical protein